MLAAIGAYLRRFNWPIFLAMAALLSISVVAVHMAEQVDPTIHGYAARQATFTLVAVAAFVVVTLIPYPRIGRWSYALFLATVVLLLVVFLFPEKRGSRRWIYIPGLSEVNLQPAELAKLTFILALAWYLRFRNNYRQLRGLIVPFLITLVPLGLILMEPDLGTSMLLLPTLMVMLFVAGARLLHLAVIVLLGLAAVLAPVPRAVDAEVFARQREGLAARTVGPVTAYSVRADAPQRLRSQAPLAYCRLQWRGGRVYDLQPLSLWVMSLRGSSDYHTRRIEGWLRQDDTEVRKSSGFQQYQSMLILGAGRLWGQRQWNEAASYFSVLPDDHTDFIFSVIGGQWGFVGCVMILALYFVIFLFGADVAGSTTDPFGRLLAVGVMALMAAQLFINIGMTIGLMPVTGMTLPLVSYGGSSLLVNGAALGLLVNVGQRRPVSLAPPAFEYGRKRPGEEGFMGPTLPDRVLDGRQR